MEKETFQKFAELYNSELHKGLGDRKIEDLTDKDFDFQGWLIPHISIREAIEKLGFKFDEETKTWSISDNDPILDKYPSIIQDDGMGYGVNECKLTDVEIDKEDIKFWC